MGPQQLQSALWDTNSQRYFEKKFSYLRTKDRSKAVSEKEKENKKTAKTLAEFRRINNKTGGGPGIDPPDEDGEDQPHDDLLPFEVEEILKV